MPETATPLSPTSAVVTYRGEALENSSIAHIAVVDAVDGRVLLGWGDVTRQTLARSAAKPAQALAVLETGAMERFGLDEADLALMCASHSSEGRHIEQTLAMLAKVGVQESDMQCGGHDSISDAVNREWWLKNFVPSAACSNCSGKHVGMLGSARAMGAPVADYHLPQHPVQQWVKKIVADAVRLPAQEVDWAIDGCNLPTPAFPLDRLAWLYASLAQAADTVDASASSKASGRTAALARIYHAMTRHPELVGGEGRFCSVLMRSFEGALVGKLGADACYGVGVRACEATRRLGARGAVGLSVKVEDGNVPVMYQLVSELLHRLDLGTSAQRAALDTFHRPPMRNTRGVIVGRVEFPFSLRSPATP